MAGVLFAHKMTFISPEMFTLLLSIEFIMVIIIGGAFGRIVSSFVNDVVMPPIGLLLGNVDFSNLFVNLSGSTYATIAAAEEAGAPILKYGTFIQTVVDFLIVAFTIFMAIKFMNRLKREEEQQPPPAPPEPSAQEKLLMEIRDALQK